MNKFLMFLIACGVVAITILWYQDQTLQRNLRDYEMKADKESKCLDSVWHRSIDTKTIPDWSVCKCK